MNLRKCYIDTKTLELSVEGSGKCKEIGNCEYLCRDTFRRLNKEEGIKQLIICASDYLSCHLNKNLITLN